MIIIVFQCLDPLYKAEVAFYIEKNKNKKRLHKINIATKNKKNPLDRGEKWEGRGA